MRPIALLLTSFAACLPASGAEVMSAPAKPGSELDLRITPRVANAHVEAIDIEEMIGKPGLKAGEVLLRMPIVRVNEPSALHDPSALFARDANGSLPLALVDDPADPSNFKQDRTWTTTRATVGEVVVRYRAEPRVITSTTRPGPLIDVRAEGSGLEGTLSMLLALPPELPAETHLQWDLHELGPGARVATSLGDGPQITTDAPRETFAESLFMLGPLRSAPESGKGPFVVYWLTEPAWDLLGAAAWTHKVYDYYTHFWGGSDQPFRVFMRTTERFQGGGGGSHHSFIFGDVAGEQRDQVGVRELMAHEAGHNFVGELTEAGTGSQWYSEGADVYYTAVLPYRAGLISIDRYLAVMNKLAAGYYLNPLSNLSNAEVTQRFFKEHDAEVVSYQRGPLYFAAVDAKLRAASGGRRRVDELVKAMVAAQRSHKLVDEALWVSLVRDALGQAGVDDFEAMMAGRPLDLPSDLLGPCFQREPMTYHRFALGFSPQTIAGERRIARLDPQSAPARAGLKDGDAILNPEGFEGRQEDAGRPLTLRVRRAGGQIEATFNPWSPQGVPGFTWVRTAAPIGACNI